jgi:8-oxo-dGTP pyrophosphatase MutT (NUDIX family)
MEGMEEEVRYFHRADQAPPVNAPTSLGAVALIESEGKVLLEERSDCRLWGFVGGKVEGGETVTEALHREVWEETGLEIASATFFGLFSDPGRVIAYPNGVVKRIVTAVFRVVPHPGQTPRVSMESKSLRWWSWNDIEEATVVETHWGILRAVRRGETLHVD